MRVCTRLHARPHPYSLPHPYPRPYPRPSYETSPVDQRLVSGSPRGPKGSRESRGPRGWRGRGSAWRNFHLRSRGGGGGRWHRALWGGTTNNTRMHTHDYPSEATRAWDWDCCKERRGKALLVCASVNVCARWRGVGEKRARALRTTHNP